MKVRLISLTKRENLTAEQIIVYTARISSPHNQENLGTAPKLLRYLIRNKHWSPFEMVDMTVEIVTSRAIAAQILRHRSFSFQEFSQRYAPAQDFELYDARRQDASNRQNSIDDLSPADRNWFSVAQQQIQELGFTLYQEALKKGIAKESARFLLPLGTQTRLFMKGNVRSWIHYLEARCAKETQLEHREIAEAVRAVFNEQFPNIAEALRGDAIDNETKRNGSAVRNPKEVELEASGRGPGALQVGRQARVVGVEQKGKDLAPGHAVYGGGVGPEVPRCRTRSNR